MLNIYSIFTIIYTNIYLYLFIKRNDHGIANINNKYQEA